jgi:hypothetical protein
MILLFQVACNVHIGEGFGFVPRTVLARLRRQLSEICRVIDELDTNPLMESLIESELAITVGAWRFAYRFDAVHDQIVVLEAARR